MHFDNVVYKTSAQMGILGTAESQPNWSLLSALPLPSPVNNDKCPFRMNCPIPAFRHCLLSRMTLKKKRWDSMGDYSDWFVE